MAIQGKGFCHVLRFVVPAAMETEGAWCIAMAVLIMSTASGAAGMENVGKYFDFSRWN